MTKQFNIIKKFESIDRELRIIKRQIEGLLIESHPPRDFVICENCKHNIKEKK